MSAPEAGVGRLGSLRLDSVPVGNTRRRLSFFVMVLCYSRLMYLEFTVSHERAQAFSGDQGLIGSD